MDVFSRSALFITFRLNTFDSYLTPPILPCQCKLPKFPPSPNKSPRIWVRGPFFTPSNRWPSNRGRLYSRQTTRSQGMKMIVFSRPHIFIPLKGQPYTCRVRRQPTPCKLGNSLFFPTDPRYFAENRGRQKIFSAPINFASVSISCRASPHQTKSPRRSVRGLFFITSLCL